MTLANRCVTVRPRVNRGVYGVNNVLATGLPFFISVKAAHDDRSAMARKNMKQVKRAQFLYVAFRYFERGPVEIWRTVRVKVQYVHVVATPLACPTFGLA
jgi:hypothetical protein